MPSSAKWLLAIGLSWMLTSACGRLAFEQLPLESDAAVADGSLDEADGLAPPVVLQDDFDRGDSPILGADWVLGPDNSSTFSILGGTLRFEGQFQGETDSIWFASPTSGLDQWFCIQFISTINGGTAGFGPAFRGHPASRFLTITGHPNGTFFANDGIFEGFDDAVLLGEARPTCSNVSGGYNPGDWMCAALEGEGATTRARMWRLQSDPGFDVASFGPPVCEWNGPLDVVDEDGPYIGFSVWDGSNDNDLRFDNARGGALGAP